MSSKLEQRVYDHLLSKFSRGEIGPGTRLSEIALAQEVGVSRTPVRQAFTRLRTEGVVDVLPRFGWFVRIPSRQEVAELYQAREMLECFTVARAAECAAPDDLNELQKLLAAMDLSLSEWRQRPRIVLEAGTLNRAGAQDRAFHEIIFRAAGNSWISRMGVQMKALGQAFNFKLAVAHAESSKMLTLPQTQQEEHIQQLARIWSDSVRDHHQIELAIRERQPKRAEQIMSRHIRAGLETSLHTLDAWRRLHPQLVGTAAIVARQSEAHS